MLSNKIDNPSFDSFFREDKIQPYHGHGTTIVGRGSGGFITTGGSVGTSVGGRSVGGRFVGGGSVGAGGSVAGGSVGKGVCVGRGSGVLVGTGGLPGSFVGRTRVGVMKKVGRCVGVSVVIRVGVMIMVGLGVAVLVGELVGVTDDVPIRNASVIAMAVRVLLALRISASVAGPPAAFQSATNKPINKPEIPNA